MRFDFGAGFITMIVMLLVLSAMTVKCKRRQCEHNSDCDWYQVCFEWTGVSCTAGFYSYIPGWGPCAHPRMMLPDSPDCDLSRSGQYLPWVANKEVRCDPSQRSGKRTDRAIGLANSKSRSVRSGYAHLSYALFSKLKMLVATNCQFKLYCDELQ